MTEFMREALSLAAQAAAEGEIPVGCVIEKDGVIVGRGRNRREAEHTALGHAEIEAIAEACRTLGEWRLSGCRLFVTLEPCPMCAGAILNARISTVVFGAWDPKAGACGSVEDLCRGQFPHRPEVISGILERECEDILKDFFKTLR
ncbi:MAG: nucleoside deaminase [Clostridia bacterium]|nr:nucleoside deaminase [Clostridia bacterium]